MHFKANKPSLATKENDVRFQATGPHLRNFDWVRANGNGNGNTGKTIPFSKPIVWAKLKHCRELIHIQFQVFTEWGNVGHWGGNLLDCGGNIPAVNMLDKALTSRFLWQIEPPDAPSAGGDLMCHSPVGRSACLVELCRAVPPP